jgi:hypothetical protein
MLVITKRNKIATQTVIIVDYNGIANVVEAGIIQISYLMIA